MEARMSDDLLRPADAPSSYYGPDGRPVFFQDPAMDRFVAVLLNLASELWIQTERVSTLRTVLERAGLTSDELDRELALAEDPAREDALKAFLARVLEPLREK
jgi:hypothetical protein